MPNTTKDKAAANDKTVYGNALQAQQMMGYQLFASAARVPAMVFCKPLRMANSNRGGVPR